MNSTIVHDATEQLKRLFNEDSTERLARESGLIRRSTGKLNPISFLIVMVVEMTIAGTHSLSMMCELLHGHGSLRMTAQALSFRLDQWATVRFLRLSYAFVLSARLRSTAALVTDAGIIGRFNNIFLEDSSSCELHQRVAGKFKGSGGSASKAGYKIHLIWNATEENVHRLNIGPGNVPDVAQCRSILNDLSEGDLVLRDLGYFDINCFREIDDLGAYFLSRLRTGTRVYTPDGRLIEDLPKHIDNAMGDSTSVEVSVLLGGDAKLAVRLVAFRVPDDVYRERMRKLNRTAQKKGRKVSKAVRSHSRFTLFVTNIPAELLSTQETYTLYKFRWQIELVFKSFKSNLQVDIIRGQSPYRVECFIISKLIAVIAISMIYSDLASTARAQHARELSLYKFTIWVLTHRYLMLLFKPEKLDYDVMEMRTLDILPLTKQKRSRKTTRQLLQEKIGYSDLHPETTD